MSTKCQSVWTEKQKCLQDVFLNLFTHNCYYHEHDNEYKNEHSAWEEVCDYLAPVDRCADRVSIANPSADVLTEADMELLLKAQPQNYSLIQAWPAFPGKPDALRQLFDHPRKINHDAFEMYRDMAIKQEEIEVVDSFYRMLELQKRPGPGEIVSFGLLFLTTTCDDTAKRFTDQSCLGLTPCMVSNEIFTAEDVEMLIKEYYASESLSNALQRLGGDPELLVDNYFNYGDNAERYDQMGGKNIKALEDLLKIEEYHECSGGDCSDNHDTVERIANTVPVILANRYQTPEKVATLFPYFQERFMDPKILNKVFTRYKELNGDPRVLRDFILDPKTGEWHMLNAVNVYSQMERVEDNDIKDILRSFVFGDPDDNIKKVVLEYIVEGAEDGGYLDDDYNMRMYGFRYKDLIDMYKRLGGSASDLVNDLDLKVAGDIKKCERKEVYCQQNPWVDFVLISYGAMGGSASGLEKYLTLDTGFDRLDTEYSVHAAQAMLSIYMVKAAQTNGAVARLLGALVKNKPGLF